MSENYNFFIGSATGNLFFMGFNQSWPSTIENKLASFARLPVGWDYGEGGPIPAARIELAAAWNGFLRTRGFLETDASPGTDGEVAIGGRLGEHYVELIFEPDNTISVAYDRNRKQIFYKLHREPWEAQLIILKLMDEIWSASTSFTGTSITARQISGFGLRSETIAGRFPSSARNASRVMAEAFAGISENFMVDGARLSANPLYFGALIQQSSRKEAV